MVTVCLLGNKFLQIKKSAPKSPTFFAFLRCVTAWLQELFNQNLWLGRTRILLGALIVLPFLPSSRPCGALDWTIKCYSIHISKSNKIIHNIVVDYFV